MVSVLKSLGQLPNSRSRLAPTYAIFSTTPRRAFAQSEHGGVFHVRRMAIVQKYGHQERSSIEKDHEGNKSIYTESLIGRYKTIASF